VNQIANMVHCIVKFRLINAQNSVAAIKKHPLIMQALLPLRIRKCSTVDSNWTY